MKSLKRVTAMLVASVLLLVAASAYIINLDMKNKQLSTNIENLYQRSIIDSITGLQNIETDMSKLLVTGDNGAAIQLLSTLSTTADATQTNLSQLPLQHTAIQNTIKFTNQLTGYSKYITDKLTRKEGLPADYKQKITELYQACVSINQEMNKVSDELSMNQIKVAELNVDLNNKSQTDKLPGMFGNVENDTLQYPTLIFDGPFSDGHEKDTPKTQRPMVGTEDAQKMVEQLFGRAFTAAGEINGDLPSYNYNADADGSYVQASVTREGGMLNWYISTRTVSTATMDETQAQAKAEAFAKKLNYGDVRVVWKEQYDNTIIYNFAPVINAVTIYPDIFKVKIALDNGEVVGYEGRSYIINNQQRTIPAPVVKMEDAKAKVSKDVTIETNRLCIAPLENKEVLCWEFYGKMLDMTYVIYISAMDGTEQGIFRIVSTETGQMIL